MANSEIKKKKIPYNSAHHKKALLAALEQSLGVVTTACEAVGIRRERYYDWIKNDPKFAKAASEAGEIRKDFVESKLLQGIKNGNPSLIIFFAKTQMKDRGYIETVVNINKEVNNLSDLSDEALDKLIKESDEALNRKP
jgi:hypothetical protein